MKKFYTVLLSGAFLISSGTVSVQKTYDVKKIPAGASINIDGSFQDWEELTNFPEDAVNEFYHTRVNNTALIAPDDDLDHQATWRLAYNDSRLYGYFEVQDDVVQDPGEFANFWHDRLEMYFQVGDDAVIPDGKGDIGGICTSGYYQYNFDLGDNPDFVQGQLPGNNDCVPIMEDNWDFEVVITDLGYAVEWSIRFDGLRDINDNAFDPSSATNLYFAPHVHDNDNTENLDEFSNPRARSYWSMENQGGDALTGGHAFGRAFWETGTAAANGAPGEAGGVGQLNFIEENLVFDLPPLPAFPADAAKEYTLSKLNADQTITLDGQGDEWESITRPDEDQMNTYYHQRVNNTALISPDDNLDHEATWKLVYDNNGIYGFFSVNDDVVQDPADATSWFHDKLEMYFQVGNAGIPSNKGDVGGLCNLGFYQYVFDINNPGFVQGDLPGNNVCVPLQQGNWEHAVEITDLGYNVEWFISFEGLKDAAGITFDPNGTTELKFAPHVHDNDNSDFGEVNPRARGYWSMANQGGDATEGGHAFEKNFWVSGTEAATDAPGESGAPGILRFGDAVLSTNNSFDRSFSIYPNPSMDNINIKGKVDHVEILSLSGSDVLKTKSGEVNKIDISSLQRGMYIIKLYNDGKYLRGYRFIKE